MDKYIISELFNIWRNEYKAYITIRMKEWKELQYFSGKLAEPLPFIKKI